MLGQNTNEFPYNYSSSELFQVHLFPQLPAVTSTTNYNYHQTFPFLPPVAGEHDNDSRLSELAYTSSSSYGGGSPTSMISTSSQYYYSLEKNNMEVYNYSPPPPPGPGGLYLFELEEATSVWKALSTAHLQGVNLGEDDDDNKIGLLAGRESSSSIILESMNKYCSSSREKANNPYTYCRYSREEKKERIERYRKKRNLRNFNKKIKYECRKTLADSRPRIRGRFAARNDNDDHDHEHDDEDWIHFLDAFSANNMHNDHDDACMP